MTTETLPTKPLKILTIDGGGLQAISTLLILDELLGTIAKTNGVQNRKPRPCDVFDTIAGIGAGGWLALLLGRFHMDVAACLSEWYKITQSITPRSDAQAMRMKWLHHCYFNPNRLIDQISRLTEIYGTGDKLYSNNIGSVRTRHVFVAALRSDSKGYNLFRTYPIPETAKLPQRLRRGPPNPADFRISSAFGVTGAAKYFSSPWKEQMGSSGKTRFSDTQFPKPHNITELALDEMWGLYGTDVPLSIIVNIGPGRPNEYDVKAIARRFSWGSTGPKISTNPKRPRSPMVEEERQPKKRSTLEQSENNSQPTSERPYVRFDKSHNRGPSVSAPGGPKRNLQRYNTFGSLPNQPFKEKLKRLEDEIEDNIKLKLDNIDQGDSKLYYRLALGQAPPGTTQNDTSATAVALEATQRYLKSPSTSETLGRIAQTCSVKVSSAEAASRHLK